MKARPPRASIFVPLIPPPRTSATSVVPPPMSTKTAPASPSSPGSRQVATAYGSAITPSSWSPSASATDWRAPRWTIGANALKTWSSTWAPLKPIGLLTG